MTSADNLKYHNKKCYFTLLFMNESRILDRARHYTHVLRKIARSEYQIIRMACTLTKINLFDLTIRMAQAFLCFFHSFQAKGFPLILVKAWAFSFQEQREHSAKLVVPRSGNDRACFGSSAQPPNRCVAAVFNVSGRHIPFSQNTVTLYAGSSPNALLLVNTTFFTGSSIKFFCNHQEQTLLTLAVFKIFYLVQEVFEQTLRHADCLIYKSK